jgi:selenide, water dikinase
VKETDRVVQQDAPLTSFSHGAGCACKLAATDLADVMRLLGPTEYPPEVLVSPATGDDAAVYELPGGLGLVQTVDFFTPIVDDPYDWGRIAATNAFSDVYAMGGRPVTALNLVAWPIQELPVEMLAQVLRGGATVAREAGVSIVGGHSIHDPEPKYGMAVTGFVDTARIVRNSTMQPGDRLVLTKPLGLGIITTAIKRGMATPQQVESAVGVMTTLNGPASEAAVEVGVSAATDVTGFGLLGHLHIALDAAKLSARVDASAVEVLPGTLELARQGVIPGGTRSNHVFVDPHMDWGELTEPQQLVLADAQTSGGMLLSVPETKLSTLLEAVEKRGVEGIEVGRVSAEARPGSIVVEGRLG